MKPLYCAILVVVVLIGFPRGGGAAELDDDAKARIAQADAGSDAIDVSDYPEAMQKNYQTFAKTCTKCHILSRPINADYALPSEWSRYVKRMMRKPGSGIPKNDAKAIYEFLTYDSAIRKKDLVEEKLATMSEPEQEEERKLIEQVRAAYESP